LPGPACDRFARGRLVAMSAEDVVNEFIARVVSMDLDGACELVAEDLEYDNVPMGKNHGPEGLKAFLGAMAGGVRDLQFVVHRQVADGNVVLNERTDRFLVGERWIELPVAGVFELRDDRIVLWRDYFDMGPVQELIAALT
jgi:limonene-1,2-epoxide hydrolase